MDAGRKRSRDQGGVTESTSQLYAAPYLDSRVYRRTRLLVDTSGVRGGNHASAGCLSSHCVSRS